MRQLGGPAAEQALVVGTAAVQAAWLGPGLFMAGVPRAAMPGFLALLLA